MKIYNNLNRIKMRKSLYIKIIVSIYAVLLFALKSNAQGFKNLDKSPHDIAYLRASMVTPPLAKVVYGRPSIKEDQKIFGSKIPYGELWRTGSNEATEIKLYQDTVIGDVIVKAGNYTLLTIPGEKEWEIILNANTDVWGAFQYDESADVARIKVPVSKAEMLKSFSIGFKQDEANIEMILGWGQTRVKIPLRIKDYYVAGI